MPLIESMTPRPWYPQGNCPLSNVLPAPAIMPLQRIKISKHPTDQNRPQISVVFAPVWPPACYGNLPPPPKLCWPIWSGPITWEGEVRILKFSKQAENPLLSPNSRFLSFNLGPWRYFFWLWGRFLKIRFWFLEGVLSFFIFIPLHLGMKDGTGYNTLDAPYHPLSNECSTPLVLGKEVSFLFRLYDVSRVLSAGRARHWCSVASHVLCSGANHGQPRQGAWLIALWHTNIVLFVSLIYTYQYIYTYSHNMLI